MCLLAGTKGQGEQPFLCLWGNRARLASQEDHLKGGGPGWSLFVVAFVQDKHSEKR